MDSDSDLMVWSRALTQQGNATMRKFRTVDEYFDSLPVTARKQLANLRKIIRQAAPAAEETISYNIPAFRWNGALVWYAAFEKHIGLYPKASAIAAFKRELEGYKTSKGAIQFPIEGAIPAALVTRIVKYRMEENARESKARSKVGRR